MGSPFFSWRGAVLESGLASTTKLVLLVIGTHMNDYGEGAFPSTKLLSKLTSLSERAVCTHTEKAEKAGWIQKIEHGFKGQKWKRLDYKIAFPNIAPPCESQTVSGDHEDWKYQIPKTKPAIEQQKSNARRAVCNALTAKRLTKGVCFACGDEKVEAHHHDYNQKLNIFWLCRKHHNEFHTWEKAAERGSVQSMEAAEPDAEAAEPDAEAAEPNDTKLLNEVQSITPVNSPSITPVNPIDQNGIDTGIESAEVGDEMFDLFWAHYPRKTNKLKARRAWKKINPYPELLNQMIIHIHNRLRRQDWFLDQKQFIPHPSTFLNGEMWEDEIIPRNGGQHGARQQPNQPRSAVERTQQACAEWLAERQGSGEAVGADDGTVRQSLDIGQRQQADIGLGAVIEGDYSRDDCQGSGADGGEMRILASGGA